MRQYLLGTLAEPAATALEERYFTDPAFFERLWNMETRLIEDYLAGRLPAAERAQFEVRYFEIPALRKRVEEVRDRARTRQSVRLRMQWMFVATAAIVICASAWYFWGATHRTAPPSRIQATIAAEPVLLAMRLSPGVAKGPSSQSSAFPASATGRVVLTLELPGRRTAVECRVTVARLNDDGGQVTVWESPRLHSVGAATGGEVRAELDRARLTAGDYVASVTGSDGAVLETYIFRTSAQH